MDNNQQPGGCGCGPDCNHDHDHDHDNEHHSITLTLEDDTELLCQVLGNFEVDGKEYIALLPEDSEEVLIYNFSETDDVVNIENIEDDAEFERAAAILEALLKEEDEDSDEA